MLLCYTICVVFVRCPATRFDSQISVKEWFSERFVLVVRDSRHRLDCTTGVIRRSIAIHSWIIMIRTLPSMLHLISRQELAWDLCINDSGKLVFLKCRIAITKVAVVTIWKPLSSVRYSCECERQKLSMRGMSALMPRVNWNISAADVESFRHDKSTGCCKCDQAQMKICQGYEKVKGGTTRSGSMHRTR